jgi:hypothetical protein
VESLVACPKKPADLGVSFGVAIDNEWDQLVFEDVGHEEIEIGEKRVLVPEFALEIVAGENFLDPGSGDDLRLCIHTYLRSGSAGGPRTEHG